MVSTPGARLIGWIQNGGQGRDVFANDASTLLPLSCTRWIVMILPLCLTCAVAFPPKVISTGLFSALAANGAIVIATATNAPASVFWIPIFNFLFDYFFRRQLTVTTIPLHLNTSP